MSEVTEWILIFAMFYIFCSVWLISNMLEKILNILAEMEKERIYRLKEEADANNRHFKENHR